ncbi:MAG: tRNA 2-thiouridine(34) synthase MnmA [Candidatus Babeliales bacterium]
MKIAVLVSGGVDSSVALHKLYLQGYEVTAYYLKIWLEDELSFLGTCPWEEDIRYVRALCEKLHIPFVVIPLQKEYEDHIISYVLHEIRQGRTPNPDIRCNELIKFGFFLKELHKHDPTCHLVASGHYARVVHEGAKASLWCSADPVKDQTYFLARLTQEQLSLIRFPLGDMTKAEVRSYAQKYGLPSCNRKDSQGLCFLGKIKFSDFVRSHMGERQGSLVEYETDAVLGTHKGYWFYTIGQRKGTGLSGGPWYVVSKNRETNTVYLSRSYYSSDKERDQCYATHCHWIDGERPNNKNCYVKLRHGALFLNAEIRYINDDLIHIRLEDRDQGIAPGQFVVMYDGRRCVGSAMITLYKDGKLYE